MLPGNSHTSRLYEKGQTVTYIFVVWRTNWWEYMMNYAIYFLWCCRDDTSRTAMAGIVKWVYRFPSHKTGTILSLVTDVALSVLQASLRNWGALTCELVGRQIAVPYPEHSSAETGFSFKINKVTLIATSLQFLTQSAKLRGTRFGNYLCHFDMCVCLVRLWTLVKTTQWGDS